MLPGAAGEHVPVSLLVLVAVATALGFAVILLVGRGQRVSPAATEHPAEPEGTELDWIRAHGAEGLLRLLRSLFAEMGFEPDRGERGQDAVAFLAVDPTPIRGGRIYVQGVLSEPGVAVGGDEVRAMLDAARGDSVGKALLVTLGRFNAEAREAARDAPVELVDGEALAALLRKHLPQAWATRTL